MALPLNGVVKRLVKDRGFGFLADHDGTEYFFHRSACLPHHAVFDTLVETDHVTFEIDSRSQKGPRAMNVQLT